MADTGDRRVARPPLSQGLTVRLEGQAQQAALRTICEHHYARSVPSGKRLVFEYESALVIFAIPANNNISRFLIGAPNKVWELSRLWAPDGHRANLLTAAISQTAKELRQTVPDIDALISYADPNVGHGGGIYRAASWTYLGQCEESRYYRDATGQVMSRRAFHSGRDFLRKADILARGYVELKRPGKHRFARGFTRAARRAIAARAQPYPALF